MKKTGIIGHRGAAGLALENTHESLLAAIQMNVDSIEFDVRRTKNNQLVLMHDNNTVRIADKTLFVGKSTLAELQNLKLKNGQTILTLEDVFKLIGDKKLLTVDIKDSGSAPEILRLIKKYPKVKLEFTSTKYHDLSELHAAHPEFPICVLDNHHPIETINIATSLRAESVSFNARWLNPVLYWLARHRKLEIRAYTINSPRLFRLFKKLYPEIVVYSDFPQRLLDIL